MARVTTTANESVYRWLAMGVVLIGTFMVILDGTIVNVALPAIAVEFGTETGIEWVVTGYLLAVGIVQPATGWMADRLGRRRVYLASLGAFGLGSLLAAVAPSLPLLIGSRFLQGLGGGAIIPVGMAMVYEAFPADMRGRALGIWGIAAMAAPALGPVVGGYLVTTADWRWLFLINVPIAVAGVIIGRVILRDLGYRETKPLDVPGLILAGGTLTVLLFTFSRAVDWGAASPFTIGGVTLGLLLLYAFVRTELRAEHPIIEVRMFAIPTFRITIAIVWLITLAQFARLVFIPLELITVRGFTALEVGWLLTPAALATAATMPIGGRLADRTGPRIPVILGMGLIAAGVFLQSRFSLATSDLALIVAFCIQGLGTGLAIMPNTLAAMDSVTGSLVAQASAVRSLNRQVAGAIGVAVLSGVVVAQIGVLDATGVAPAAAQSAYNSVFVIATVAAVAAGLLAFRLPDRARTMEIREDRERERQALID